MRNFFELDFYLIELLIFYLEVEFNFKDSTVEFL
jgi:hypothetical protein